MDPLSNGNLRVGDLRGIVDPRGSGGTRGIGYQRGTRNLTRKYYFHLLSHFRKLKFSIFILVEDLELKKMKKGESQALKLEREGLGGGTRGFSDCQCI